MKNVAAAELKSSGMGARAKESGSEPASVTHRSSSSSDSKGKSKTIMIGNEEESRPCYPRMSFEEQKNEVYTFW